ncbi:hypothetical protein OGR47_14410 [Methylocystis sp. MJC1]|jgi:hypothetical protein|uniref:hypothetical protein n=1 Tax=Methylocystis sp. MJC1 TaxID=2654282 RepID=UPI001FEDE008|nr:hypothetical protein [Methylocystis sp. MJC1]KAF2990359.1 hypothetical protein MJC1_02458 [Methylocystis sp. MJC1]UZX11067.1 hypothetical protein OGR47_14410 [Methylocystis sp. MJC1]
MTDLVEQRALKSTQTLPGAAPAEEQPNAFSSGVALQDATVLIHVRFRPDGNVWEIAECPDFMDKDEWFKRLCARAGDKFQARCGARGLFRLSLAQLEALKAPVLH